MIRLNRIDHRSRNIESVFVADVHSYPGNSFTEIVDMTDRAIEQMIYNPLTPKYYGLRDMGMRGRNANVILVIVSERVEMPGLMSMPTRDDFCMDDSYEVKSESQKVEKREENNILLLL